ncbi:MAG: tetratricopeptide repeat protein, partial [Planctomycetales bacterium]|nr:tetratricopeptide repeat protein [Planctomycetales bacterium]
PKSQQFDPPPRRRSPPGEDRGYGQPRGAKLYAIGLACMRAGEYEPAIDFLERANTEDRGWPGRGLPQPVLAITHRYAGDTAQAQAALESTDQQYDEWVRQMERDPLGRLPIPWFDWTEFVTLRSEAHRLILGKPPKEDQRLVSLEAHARSRITQGQAASDWPPAE